MPWIPKTVDQAKSIIIFPTICLFLQKSRQNSLKDENFVKTQLISHQIFFVGESFDHPRKQTILLWQFPSFPSIPQSTLLEDTLRAPVSCLPRPTRIELLPNRITFHPAFSCNRNRRRGPR
ncbi:hypothetical protein NPIL_621711 [Nephila pilipes]|uniref:Uncharacterized protein n=1 Tax=Nephila pilipes TaxID=299642 RepID=A0A8X6R5L2_NEPPI|nr:hypothetical protein NPIL_621711 [Nephila pilipes]